MAKPQKSTTGAFVPPLQSILSLYVTHETREATARGKYRDGDEQMYSAELYRLARDIFNAGARARQKEGKEFVNPYDTLAR